ncbi:hypothetical protein HU200_041009 [Digitaria exilis]|uniref:Uncharacterized protein n=1 Tax=Digitaria exilis TaxID=1010633 RepID=A0A835BG30_9POAL|nr:hypothetical protein HU200_041009 [Digitaria exilis]
MWLLLRKCLSCCYHVHGGAGLLEHFEGTDRESVAEPPPGVVDNRPTGWVGLPDHRCRVLYMRCLVFVDGPE